MAEFIHLHLHTEYSLLDGACRVGELLEHASRQKIAALAVTEHGNLFSSVVFHDKARKQGIKPILGCETYVATGSRFTRKGSPGETNNHLVLLAETMEGYHNLIQLVSAAYTEGFYYRPRIDKELLAQHSRGLIGLSSCLKGEIPVHLRGDQEARAIAAAGGVPRHPRAGQFLPRDAGPGDPRAEDRQRRAASRRPIARPAARVHQRRALPDPRGLQGPRRPALHRHRKDGARHRADAATTATSST